MRRLYRVWSQSPRLFLWIVAKNAVHPFRRLLSRHRQRGNARFDRQAGVRTNGKMTVEELGLSPVHSHGYEATPINFFHSVLAKLSTDYKRTVFIDLGCGKGRTLLLASDYPFRSIIGVEISEALSRIAVENVKRYASTRRNLPEISILCRAIEDFEYDTIQRSNHVLVYMFNPCGEPVFAAGLQKLSCLAAQGVRVTIIYLNPTYLEVLATASWLKEICRGETFADASNCFIAYVVFQSLPSPGKEMVSSDPMSGRQPRKVLESSCFPKQ